MFEIKKLEDIENLVTGLTFFGTGGGGNPDRGREILKNILESGYRISWIDLSEIKDEGVAVTPYIMGSAAPESPETTNIKREIGLIDKIWNNPMLQALRELEGLLGKRASYIVPLELGGGSTSRALSLSSLAGIDMIDGDYAGRAVPEITQVLPSIYGCKAVPIVGADDYGNIVIIKNSINNMVAERMGKLVSEMTYAQVGFPLDIEIAKQFVITGTLTKSYYLGKLLNSTSDVGACIERMRREFGSELIFKGILEGISWRNVNYYMVGESKFKGIEEYEGETMVIWFKNENHLAFREQKLTASSPDLISIISQNNCKPLTNTSLKKDDRYFIFETRSVPLLKTKVAQKFIGKDYFLNQYKKFKKR